MNQRTPVHACRTGDLTCSGIRPCQGCFDFIRTLVLPRAMFMAGGPFATRNSPHVPQLMAAFEKAWDRSFGDVSDLVVTPLSPEGGLVQPTLNAAEPTPFPSPTTEGQGALPAAAAPNDDLAQMLTFIERVSPAERQSIQQALVAGTLPGVNNLPLAAQNQLRQVLGVPLLDLTVDAASEIGPVATGLVVKESDLPDAYHAMDDNQKAQMREAFGLPAIAPAPLRETGATVDMSFMPTAFTTVSGPAPRITGNVISFDPPAEASPPVKVTSPEFVPVIEADDNEVIVAPGATKKRKKNVVQEARERRAARREARREKVPGEVTEEELVGLTRKPKTEAEVARLKEQLDEFQRQLRAKETKETVNIPISEKDLIADAIIETLPADVSAPEEQENGAGTLPDSSTVAENGVGQASTSSEETTT